MTRGRGNDVDSGVRRVCKRKGEQRAGLALLRKNGTNQIFKIESKINEQLTVSKWRCQPGPSGREKSENHHKRDRPHTYHDTRHEFRFVIHLGECARLKRGGRLVRARPTAAAAANTATFAHVIRIVAAAKAIIGAAKTKAAAETVAADASAFECRSVFGRSQPLGDAVQVAVREERRRGQH